MSRVLIIEDEVEIADLEKDYLELSGFEVEIENDGTVGLKRALTEDFDMYILDLMLPGIDGFEICKQIREEKNTPILMVSAKKDDIDKIRGLGLGADDYIIKPFRPRELTARIRTALRKYGSSPSAFEMCDLHVDTASGVVKKGGREVFLSALEYRLLLIFINNPNVIITRDRLLDELWDAAGEFVNNNTLTVYIKRLREKIEDDPGNPQIILTVRGTGYRLGGSYVSE